MIAKSALKIKFFLFLPYVDAPAKSLNCQLKTVIMGRKRHCFRHFLTFDAGILVRKPLDFSQTIHSDQSHLGNISAATIA